MRHSMSSDDWYRNRKWSPSIAEKFEVKLKRARKKAQYLRIQACCLAETDPVVALELLNRYFDLDDHFDHAQAYVDRATALRALGRITDALSAYEDAIRREAEFPNLKTQAYLQLPLLVASTPVPKKFDRALQILDESRERVLFPVDKFHWNAAYALILSRQERNSEASDFAQAALEFAGVEHSGFRYHQKSGLVGEAQRSLIRDLKLLVNAA